MKKVKLTKDAVINGQHYKLGAVLEFKSDYADFLFEHNIAEPVNE